MDAQETKVREKTVLVKEKTGYKRALPYVMI